MVLWPIFLAVFLGELGDKTQLATLLFAADTEVSKVGVCLASSGVLVLSRLIAVLLGSQLSHYFSTGVEDHGRGRLHYHWHMGILKRASRTQVGVALSNWRCHNPMGHPFDHTFSAQVFGMEECGE